MAIAIVGFLGWLIYAVLASVPIGFQRFTYLFAKDYIANPPEIGVGSTDVDSVRKMITPQWVGLSIALSWLLLVVLVLGMWLWAGWLAGVILAIVCLPSAHLLSRLLNIPNMNVCSKWAVAELLRRKAVAQQSGNDLAAAYLEMWIVEVIARLTPWLP
jgi:hypothetical protein